MDNKIGSSTIGGAGFVGLLTIVFVVLKCCRVISWSWLWVLSPIWISWALMFIGFIVFAIWMRKRW